MRSSDAFPSKFLKYSDVKTKMVKDDWHDRLWYRCQAYGEEINDGTPRTDAECEALIASYFPPNEEPGAYKYHLHAFRSGRSNAKGGESSTVGQQS
jgi:hypothetical protein